MSTYTVVVQETVDQLSHLNNSQYNLAFTKSVSQGGTSTFKTIWQSTQGVTSEMTLTWMEDYGLNFSDNVPAPSAPVTVAGTWQPCILGAGYTLTEEAKWASNNDSRNRQGFLNVLNSFRDTCIVIGQKDPGSGVYQPIYFSPDKLLMNSVGHYQPQDDIQLWFGTNQTTGSVIADQETQVCNFNMSSTAASGSKHYFQWKTDGTWSDQATPFPGFS